MSDPDSLSGNDPIPDPSPSRIQSSPPLPLLPPPPTAQADPDLKIASVAAPSSKSSRRLPPPCWSPEETVALIDAYRDKWSALNRGNLKANHWEEVAEAVASNCPDAAPPKKTAVQCRHKMEKLRKRYRTEIQRARSVPVARFVSSWVHFNRMEAMEIRPLETKQQSREIGDDGDGGDVNYAPRFQFSGGATPRFFNRNGTAGSSGGGGGIRIRIPTGVSVAKPGPRFGGKIDQKYTSSPISGISTNPRGGGSSSYGGGGKRGREMMKTEETEEEEEDTTVEIATAIKMLGDTLLRTEQTKMEMMREIEAMRMETEMKRTKMILDSQQRIVEAFAKTISENTTEKTKKKKARSLSSLEQR
ncbi:unnamed protein product [Cochlearia groenlandica]